MAKARKVYLLLIPEESSIEILGVFSSKVRAENAMKADATLHARSEAGLNGSYLKVLSKKEYRLMLPDGSERRYLIRCEVLDGITS